MRKRDLIGKFVSDIISQAQPDKEQVDGVDVDHDLMQASIARKEQQHALLFQHDFPTSRVTGSDATPEAVLAGWAQQHAWLFQRAPDKVRISTPTAESAKEALSDQLSVERKKRGEQDEVTAKGQTAISETAGKLMLMSVVAYTVSYHHRKPLSAAAGKLLDLSLVGYTLAYHQERARRHVSAVAGQLIEMTAVAYALCFNLGALDAERGRHAAARDVQKGARDVQKRERGVQKEEEVTALQMIMQEIEEEKRGRHRGGEQSAVKSSDAFQIGTAAMAGLAVAGLSNALVIDALSIAASVTAISAGMGVLAQAVQSSSGQPAEDRAEPTRSEEHSKGAYEPRAGE